MIKKIVIAALLFTTCYSVNAQHYYREGERNRERDTYQDEETYGDGFKKEHMFIGGNLGLGYDSYTFNAGISPEVGYSLNRWLDVGALVNLNYSSMRADPSYNFNPNVRQRSFNYGVGAFASFYPLPFLYIQVRPEYNWVNVQNKYYDSPSSSGSYTTSAPSLLLGIGYGQRLVGRSKMNLTLMMDVINSNQSPYRDFNGAVIPVLKAGFDIYFKPRKQ